MLDNAPQVNVGEMDPVLGPTAVSVALDACEGPLVDQPAPGDFLVLKFGGSSVGSSTRLSQVRPCSAVPLP